MSDEDWDIRIKPRSARGSSTFINSGTLMTIIGLVILVVAVSSVILRLIQTGFQDLNIGFAVLCISVLLLIIGLSLSATGIKQRQGYNEFENTQRIANGEVVDRGIETRVLAGENGEITGAARLIWVIVRFQAVTRTGLQQVNLRAHVSMKVYRKLLPGNAIKIRYSCSNPQMALLEGE